MNTEGDVEKKPGYIKQWCGYKFKQEFHLKDEQ